MIRRVGAGRRWRNFLFYGDYGVGKTTLAASACEVPEMLDVIMASAEAGEMSVEEVYPELDVVPITAYNQFARFHEFLKLHCKARDEGNEDYLRKLEARFRGVPESEIEKPRKYRTVIVDSLTEVQKYCMYQLLGIKVGEFALDIEPEQAQYAEWNKSAEMIRLLVRTFRNMPIHTIFVCARAVEQDEAKRFHYSPLLPGKLASEVQGFFDVVGFMVAAPNEGGDIQRRLWLVPGKTFQAKNRLNFKGSYIDNPKMADLMKYSLKPEYETKHFKEV